MKGRNPQTGEALDDRMDEDGVGDKVEKSAKRNPTELSKKNVRKLRQRPVAIKWVRKLRQLLETQNDRHEKIPPWACGVWEIIMSMNKSAKQYLKDEARAKREKQKQREKKARKKAKRQARKEAGKKTRDSCDSSSSDNETSSSEKSSDNCTTSANSNPQKRTRGRRVGAVSSAAAESNIINGKLHFQSETGKWVDCSAPPSKPCERYGQRH